MYFCFVSGSDCYEKFKTMQTCMQKYPTLYNKDLADDDELSDAIEKSEKASAASAEKK